MRNFESDIWELLDRWITPRWNITSMSDILSTNKCGLHFFNSWWVFKVNIITHCLVSRNWTPTDTIQKTDYCIHAYRNLYKYLQNFSRPSAEYYFIKVTSLKGTNTLPQTLKYQFTLSNFVFALTTTLNKTNIVHHK